MSIRELFGAPDRRKAIANYERLAARYDASCRRISSLREIAIAALELRPGETVFDVACGTGAALPLLGSAVGPDGLVVGIEQSRAMAEIARGRLAGTPSRCRIVEASVEELALDERAHAMLLTYTHDLLQSPRAIALLAAHARPGCRVAVLGVRALPWSWGFAVNAFTLIRGRRYLTTLRGIREPWRRLETACTELRPVRHFHLGTSYLAVGRFPVGLAHSRSNGDRDS